MTRCGCQRLLDEMHAHDGNILYFEALKKAFLRDFFAATVLGGGLKDVGANTFGDADLAKRCYQMADAMMAERKKETK